MDFTTISWEPEDFLELESLLTPSKGNNFFTGSKGDNVVNSDEDSGLGMDTDSDDGFQIQSLPCSNFQISTLNDDFRLPSVADLRESTNSLNDSYEEIKRPSRKTLSRFRSFNARRTLQTLKRRAEDDTDDNTPISKRKRDAASLFGSSESTKWTNPAVPLPICAPEARIISAVDRLTSEDDLLPDGSRAYCLPTIPSKHQDLKCISSETMASVLRGEYSAEIQSATVIDCRYPYEYDGGHIQGAVNLYTRYAIKDMLYRPLPPRPADSKRHILVFHCEFSSERGPKMYRFLRSEDRDMNSSNYPHLKFPEMYLLEGGYKVFYENHKDLCFPQGYKPMLHQDHADDLRHFRVKSKTWTSGEMRPRYGSGSRQTLKF